MFDLGNEFVIGSYRVPWLIWIQLLVMILIIILLYHIIISVDPFPTTAVNASPEIVLDSKSSGLRSPSSAADATSSRFPSAKVRESQCINNATGTTTRRRRGRKDDMHEKEGDSSQITVFERSYHPCHYLGLARRAFLKCLGLDFSSKDSPNDAMQRKEQ